MKDFLHHLFFPRESNNHRAKLLHHDSLLIVIAFFLASALIFTTVHKAYPKVLGITSDISSSDLLFFTNQKREANGLSDLKLDSELTQAAQQKANNMFANNYWAHIAPDGTTPWYFIKSSGYDYLYAGENLARGFNTAPDVVNAWMNSPTHRENMLSRNYDDVGFAVQTGTLTGSDTILVVEELGRRYNGTPTDVKTAVAPITPTPTPVVAANITPTPIVSSPITPKLSPQPVVAAVQNKPLVDSKSMTKQIALVMLFLFIAVLIIDAVIIERNKIARVVAHNLDHIIFFVVIIIVIIIIGRGLII